MRKIDNFGGKYSFLSNFYPSQVEWEDDLYPTVEHAFQAAKTGDPVERAYVREADTPGKAKRRGRKVTLREDWHTYRLVVMEQLLRDKFTRHPELGKKLLATVPAQLVEGNTWKDMYWGVYKGRGQNHLGRLLMQVREDISASENHQP